jgi:hypothetical protein
VALVHIDAHPDLSTPSASESHTIADWNDVDTLYEILAEPGGIAEFIIPLFTKHLISQMIWVRSPWSNQLPDGYKKFAVGEYKEQPKVNWRIPYYLDDFSYSADLQTHSHIHLTTCLSEDELCWHDSVLKRKDFDVPSSSSNGKGAKMKRTKRKQRWILDICLDYFSTSNPFLDLFCERLRADQVDEEKIEEWVEVLKEVWSILPFRNPPYKHTRTHCMSIIQQLHSTYTEQHKQQVLDLFAKEHEVMVRKWIEEIMPVISIETMRCFTEQGHLLLLPHHPITQTETLQQHIHELENFIEKLVVLFMTELQAEERKDDWLPLFITMARSSSDGYTVNFLQQATIDMIERVFNRTLSGQKEVEVIVHDLAANPIQGAYELLLPRHYATQQQPATTEAQDTSDKRMKVDEK